MSTERAKELRAMPSLAEKMMWRLLYTFRTGGYHFRKQSQIGPYYADFACHHAKLVIEVDGDTHYTDSGQRHDARRDAFLAGEGYTVLRFTNDDVVENANGVFLAVEAALTGRPQRPRKRPSPLPTSPTRGEVSAGGRGEIAPATTRSTGL